MGFLDKVKGATGIGLNSTEAYHRAYEKGVLLGKYDSASELFGKAAEKFEQEGQPDLARRARANQHIYSFVSTKNTALINDILRALEGADEVEEIGSETEKISAPELCAELEARRLENAAFASENAPSQAQLMHANAALKFQAILKAKLKTYKYVPAKDHNDTAEERYFLHMGHSAYYQGLLVQDRDPMQAAERLSQAALAFKRAKDEALHSRMDAIVGNLRVRRTCWVCHREMQGFGLNISYMPATTTVYGRELVAKLGQDTTSIVEEAVAVCLPCASMVRNQADEYSRRRTDELRQEVEPQLAALIRAANALADRVAHLESVSHRHS